jgi:hypothetical protein
MFCLFLKSPKSISIFCEEFISVLMVEVQVSKYSKSSSSEYVWSRVEKASVENASVENAIVGCYIAINYSTWVIPV